MIIGIRQRAIRNSKNRKLVACIVYAMLVALCGSAEAEQPGKVPKIGLLGGGPASLPWHSSFKQEFQKLGYIDGKNVTFIYRFADTNYDLLPTLADELVRLKVDVIITPGSNDTRAAKSATKKSLSSFLVPGLILSPSGSSRV